MLARVLSFCLLVGSLMRLIRQLSFVCCRREFLILTIVFLTLSKFVNLLHYKEFGERRSLGEFPPSLVNTHLSAGRDC